MFSPKGGPGLSFCSSNFFMSFNRRLHPRVTPGLSFCSSNFFSIFNRCVHPRMAPGLLLPYSLAIFSCHVFWLSSVSILIVRFFQIFFVFFLDSLHVLIIKYFFIFVLLQLLSLKIHLLFRCDWIRIASVGASYFSQFLFLKIGFKSQWYKSIKAATDGEGFFNPTIIIYH